MATMFASLLDLQDLRLALNYSTYPNSPAVSAVTEDIYFY